MLIHCQKLSLNLHIKTKKLLNTQPVSGMGKQCYHPPSETAKYILSNGNNPASYKGWGCFLSSKIVNTKRHKQLTNQSLCVKHNQEFPKYKLVYLFKYKVGTPYISPQLQLQLELLLLTIRFSITFKPLYIIWIFTISPKQNRIVA